MGGTEKRVGSRYVFRGKILNVRVDTVILPDGREGTREVVEYAGAVTILPLTEAGEVVLVRQYRYPVGRTLLEIPAGKVEAGEDPLACARRELREETGYEAERWEKLLTFYSTPGFTSEKMHLYLATELKAGPQMPDGDEFVEVVQVPFREALAMVRNGTICDAKSVVGLLFAAHLGITGG
ncbi:MAG: NUDIX hydrolase [Bacillota bacterium]